MDTTRKMTAEFQRVCADALMIYSGASNPLGVSKAYARACEECYALTSSMQPSMEWAPARLIHAQLGHLHRVGIGGYAEGSEYDPQKDEKWCKEVTGLEL